MLEKIKNPNKQPRKQTGTALLFSLTILVVMTMLGITAMRNTVLETKMSTNAQQKQIAYEAAEKALRDAQNWLRNNINSDVSITNNFTGNGGLYNSRDNGSPNWLNNTSTWTAANSVAALGLNGVNGNNPRYVIEYIGRVERHIPQMGSGSYDPISDPRGFAFRITALGYGADPAARYLLSSTVRVGNCSVGGC